MIPKRIFYVWGANEAKKRDVLACMQSWRQNCPDYEIIEINEESKDYFNFQKELKRNKWFRAVYERKMWAYIADYVRIKALYDNGGIYLDTDVTVIKPFDLFLNDGAFVGMQSNSVETNTDYVEPAVLGAQKGNGFLEKIRDFYEENIWKEPIFTMPQIFEKFFKQEYQLNTFPQKNQQNLIILNEMTIYPERYFIPFRYQETFSPKCIEKDTHTIHWFGGSWTNPDIVYWLMNKHKPECAARSIRNVLDKVWRINLFKIIPVLKLIQKGEDLNIYFFTFLPFIRVKKKKVYLLFFIPFFSIKEKMKVR